MGATEDIQFLPFRICFTMNVLPLELRESPVPLVAVVPCSEEDSGARLAEEIAVVLAAAQRATGAAPTASSAIVAAAPSTLFRFQVLSAKHAFVRRSSSRTDSELEAYAPAGVLRADWAARHGGCKDGGTFPKNIVPALVVFVIEVDLRPAASAAVAAAAAAVRLGTASANSTEAGASSEAATAAAAASVTTAATESSITAAIAGARATLRERGVDVHLLLMQEREFAANGFSASDGNIRSELASAPNAATASSSVIVSSTSSVSALPVYAAATGSVATSTITPVPHPLSPAGLLASFSGNSGGNTVTAEARALQEALHQFCGALRRRAGLEALSISVASRADFAAAFTAPAATPTTGAIVNIPASPRSPASGNTAATATNFVPVFFQLESLLRERVYKHYAAVTARLKARLGRLGGHGIVQHAAAVGGMRGAASAAPAAPPLRGAPIYRARLAFKIAFYEELRARPDKALKYYSSCYRALVMAGAACAAGAAFGGSGGAAAAVAAELTAVAEVVNYKIILAYLAHGTAHVTTPSGITNLAAPHAAVMQFQFHMRSWESGSVGDAALTPVHLGWVTRQYELFAELLTALLPPATYDTKPQYAPSHLFHTAALYAVRRRRSAEALGLSPRPALDEIAARALAEAGAAPVSPSAGPLATSGNAAPPLEHAVVAVAAASVAASAPVMPPAHYGAWPRLVATPSPLPAGTRLHYTVSSAAAANAATAALYAHAVVSEAAFDHASDALRLLVRAQAAASAEQLAAACASATAQLPPTAALRSVNGSGTVNLVPLAAIIEAQIAMEGELAPEVAAAAAGVSPAAAAALSAFSSSDFHTATTMPAARGRAWRQALAAEELLAQRGAGAASAAAALHLLLPAAAVYRRSGWWPLLTRALQRARECAVVACRWRVFTLASLVLLAPPCRSVSLPPEELLRQLRAVTANVPEAATAAASPAFAVLLPPHTALAGKAAFGAALVPTRLDAASHCDAASAMTMPPMVTAVVAFSRREMRYALLRCGGEAEPPPSLTLRLVLISNFHLPLTFAAADVGFLHYAGGRSSVVDALADSVGGMGGLELRAPRLLAGRTTPQELPSSATESPLDIHLVHAVAAADDATCAVGTDGVRRAALPESSAPPLATCLTIPANGSLVWEFTVPCASLSVAALAATVAAGTARTVAPEAATLARCDPIAAAMLSGRLRAGAGLCGTSVSRPPADTPLEAAPGALLGGPLVWPGRQRSGISSVVSAARPPVPHDYTCSDVALLGPVLPALPRSIDAAARARASLLIRPLTTSGDAPPIVDSDAAVAAAQLIDTDVTYCSAGGSGSVWTDTDLEALVETIVCSFVKLTWPLGAIVGEGNDPTNLSLVLQPSPLSAADSEASGGIVALHCRVPCSTRAGVELHPSSMPYSVSRLQPSAAHVATLPWLVSASGVAGAASVAGTSEPPRLHSALSILPTLAMGADSGITLAPEGALPTAGRNTRLRCTGRARTGSPPPIVVSTANGTAISAAAGALGAFTLHWGLAVSAADPQLVLCVQPQAFLEVLVPADARVLLSSGVASQAGVAAACSSGNGVVSMAALPPGTTFDASAGQLTLWLRAAGDTAIAGVSQQAVLSAFFLPPAVEAACGGSVGVEPAIVFAHHTLVTAVPPMAVTLPHPAGARACGATLAGATLSPRSAGGSSTFTTAASSGSALAAFSAASANLRAAARLSTLGRLWTGAAGGEANAAAWPLLFAPGSSEPGTGASAKPILLDLTALRLHMPELLRSHLHVSTSSSAAVHSRVPGTSFSAPFVAVAGVMCTGARASAVVHLHVTSPFPVRLHAARLRRASSPGLAVITSESSLDESLLLVAGTGISPSEATNGLGGGGSDYGGIGFGLLGLPNMPREMQAAMLSQDGARLDVNDDESGRLCPPGDVLVIPLTIEAGQAATGVSLGSLDVDWSPTSGSKLGAAVAARTTTVLPLPRMVVVDPPLLARVSAPTTGALGFAFPLVLALENRSPALIVLHATVDHPSVPLLERQAAQATAAASASAAASAAAAVVSMASTSAAAAAAVAAPFGVPLSGGAASAAPLPTATLPAASSAAASAAAAALAATAVALSQLPLLVTSGPAPATALYLPPGARVEVTWICLPQRRGCVPLPSITLRAAVVNSALGRASVNNVAGTATSSSAAIGSAVPSSRPATGPAAAAGLQIAVASVLAGAPTISALLVVAAASSAAAYGAAAAGAAPPALQALLADAAAAFVRPGDSLSGDAAAGNALAVAALLLNGPDAGAPALPPSPATGVAHLRLADPPGLRTTLFVDACFDDADASADAVGALAGPINQTLPATLAVPPTLRVVEPPLCIIGGPLQPQQQLVSWVGPPLEDGGACSDAVEPLWCPLLPLLVD